MEKATLMPKASRTVPIIFSTYFCIRLEFKVSSPPNTTAHEPLWQEYVMSKNNDAGCHPPHPDRNGIYETLNFSYLFQNAG